VPGLRRILLNRTTFLLAPLLAALALWLRSYHVTDSLAWNSSTRAVKLSTNDCTLELWCLPGHLDFLPDGWSYDHWPNERTEYIWGWRRLDTDNQFKLAVPCWLLVLLATLPPIAVLIARTRRRRLPHLSRRAAGRLCPTCNYDLRATPQGSRCPECGTIQTKSGHGAGKPTAMQID
jgi:hypothetical protein